MNPPALQEKPVSVGDWIITMIVFCIPIVGIIMLFVWAFSDSTTASKRNYCRACLVMAVIGFVLSLLFLFAFGGLAMLTAASSGRY